MRAAQSVTPGLLPPFVRQPGCAVVRRSRPPATRAATTERALTAWSPHAVLRRDFRAVRWMVGIACGCPGPGSRHRSHLEARVGGPDRLPAVLRPSPRPAKTYALNSPAKAWIRPSRYGISPDSRTAKRVRESELGGAYHIALTAKRGQTLGQMVLGIRVVDAKTATLPTLKQSAVRWAVAVVPDRVAQLVPLSARVELRPRWRSSRTCSPRSTD